MAMMCVDPKKGKEKVHVKVELSNDGSDCLEVSDDVDQEQVFMAKVWQHNSSHSS